jgi:hypothetical protein
VGRARAEPERAEPERAALLRARGRAERAPGAGQGGASIVSKVTNATSGATNFYSPMDAVPSPDGATIYFIAFTTDGEAAIFKVPRGGRGR